MKICTRLNDQIVGFQPQTFTLAVTYVRKDPLKESAV